MVKKVYIIVLLWFLVTLCFAQQDSIRQTPPQAESLIVEQLDNLMNSWYAKKILYHENSQKPFSETSIEAINKDSIMMLRLQALTEKTLFPMVFNEEIRNYINLYLRRKNQVSVMLGLAKYYFPMFEEALDKYGCPLELRYLAVIESALNPNAVSRAGATGLWQFMYNTGKMYGLEVNTLVDDRRNPFLATDAAARHLKDLSNIFFNDWVLAMAAYNCGAGNVKKAIIRSGGKTDFWEIYNYLPRETRGYIPAFYGAWFAMQYYDKYDICDSQAKFGQVDTVHIEKKVHLQQISTVLNIPIEELNALNPQYKKNIIPLSNEIMTLTLPIEYINNFLILKDSIYNYNVDSFFSNSVIADNIFFNHSHTIDSNGFRLQARYHTVKSGESLSIISRKYHTSATEIAKLNKISVNKTIHPGQKLIVGYKKIPIPAPKTQTADSTNKDSTVTISTSVSHKDSINSISTNIDSTNISETKIETNVETKIISHIVKNGETLFSIARTYNVSVQQIADFNHFSINEMLKTGQNIKIPAQ